MSTLALANDCVGVAYICLWDRIYVWETHTEIPVRLSGVFVT